ncbi:MAG: hypothetical protein QOC83_5362, partial [Pseudonocardiales bacterium]|nr:hypothetical protein [Pseudonocardiales bacterium]
SPSSTRELRAFFRPYRTAATAAG